MKQLLLLTTIVLAGAANAFGQTRAMAWEPPTFEESEWTYIGEGTYTPGVFDYFDEITYALTTKVWVSTTIEGDYWIEAQPEPDADMEGGEFGFPGPFIVHAANPDKVYTDPIWSLHPLLFCMFPLVPEIMGVNGSDDAYGQMDADGFISFPANNYSCQTLPIGAAVSNIAGEFSLIIPLGSSGDEPNGDEPNEDEPTGDEPNGDEPNDDEPNGDEPNGDEPTGDEPNGDEPNGDEPNEEAGVTQLQDADNCTEYYNIQGLRVLNPQRGNFYIVKNGNKIYKQILR